MHTHGLESSSVRPLHACVAGLIDGCAAYNVTRLNVWWSEICSAFFRNIVVACLCLH